MKIKIFFRCELVSFLIGLRTYQHLYDIIAFLVEAVSTLLWGEAEKDTKFSWEFYRGKTILKI